MGAALGDAAFMTGLERNSDVVIMSAYAPLFVNVNPGGMQWSSDLIGYDALTSYGSPSYYAQVMFASCLGDHTVESSARGRRQVLLLSHGVSEVGEDVSKACECGIDATAVEYQSAWTFWRVPCRTVQTLKANTTWATNTITEPKQIIPMNSEVKVNGGQLEYVLPGYSIQVMEVDSK